jgi:5-oxoprolinase (ATP-hydrolysing)
MTNSRLTDPEVLEMRFPVLLEDFRIRGGERGPAPAAGDAPSATDRREYRAGRGTERRLRFLERMDCAILSSHRRVRPHGTGGGAAGEVGATFVRRADGRLEQLEGCDQTALEPGEAVIVRTPTGGEFRLRR